MPDFSLPAFTVFTPTYNRAHTLPRVYDSLRRQTFTRFEWLVIDDGSTDDTRRIVAAWQADAPFSIRYLFQENQGKHAAFNRAVAEAAAELFINLDSDDACTPDALARFHDLWESIPPSERMRYSGVTCLCQDSQGNVVGNYFPRNGMDSNYLELRYRFRVHGEKWSCQRTAVLREFPFPIEPMYYLPEGIVWSRIARHYQERCVNEPLRIDYTDGPSLVHGQAAARGAAGGRQQHLQALNDELDYFCRAPSEFCRSAVHYSRFSCLLGIPLSQQWRDLHCALGRLLWLTWLPVGWWVYRRDRRSTLNDMVEA